MFKLKFINPFKKPEETAEKENTAKETEQPVTETAEASAMVVAEQNSGEITEQTFAVAETTSAEISSDKKDGKVKEKEVTDFSRLAEILNKDETSIIEECKLFQIKNIMSLISKAVVRHGVSDGVMKNLVKNAFISGLGELAVSPAYLDGVIKFLKDEENIKVCAVIDFPFGESSFKVKFTEIKNSVRRGVDAFLSVLNAAAMNKENAKTFRKEIKKISKIKGVEKGVAINAEDVSSEEIKRLLKIAEKAGFDYVAFLFGNVTESELADKMKEINGEKGKIAVKVMANVEDVKGVKALIALGVDGIITPYADDIAKELFKEFGIKSVKLA